MARADDTVAISALRTIALAERTYSVSNGGDYATLKQLTEGGFLDSRFAGDKPVRDYVLQLKLTTKDEGGGEASYSCNADPDQIGDRAGRHFYIDSTSNLIHVNDTQSATAADRIVQ
ncbi:MAG: hypothetical protein C5B55_00640 [Blastocatellia bacterium]|nr:MAG: hypothetical protein C5B55_00640 [Blastocatellia bacterium]